MIAPANVDDVRMPVVSVPEPSATMPAPVPERLPICSDQPARSNVPPSLTVTGPSGSRSDPPSRSVPPETVTSPVSDMEPVSVRMPDPVLIRVLMASSPLMRLPAPVLSSTNVRMHDEDVKPVMRSLSVSSPLFTIVLRKGSLSGTATVFMPAVELFVRLLVPPSVSVLVPDSVAGVVPVNDNRATLRSAVSSG
ncbi:MAG: hypothetical protein WCC69_09860 [Pirellulales bacterium]